ncbi:hypothetical protein Athai_05610 [Actinocatenispora thailandica]|uniref:Uncharacterized protein n=1 Tax=Actinocatenispora thailandica TaxID=227318 RepID=A0A7R7DK51_9ACTN|nr:hypothetical protein [Actinocatenispora thailandica]BCJ33058.1 hypothetical protein Athai_05610 [Actinocatenispora thailandica]
MDGRPADRLLAVRPTGHGSIVASPDGRQLYYLHHGRPTATTPDRRLYTERLSFDARHPDPGGNPTLRIEQPTGDEPIPSGVAPYSIGASASAITLAAGGAQQVTAKVRNADGGALPVVVSPASHRPAPRSPPRRYRCRSRPGV